MTYKEDIENFTLEENRHKYAAWCAAKAASTKTMRFSVKCAGSWIDKTSLREISKNWDALPSPDDFDDVHREIRKTLLEASCKSNKKITHGIAAKLINIYLKTIFVVGVEINYKKLAPKNKLKLNAIHPPIDRLVLRKLYSAKFTDEVGPAIKSPMSWSQLSSHDYESVVKRARQVTACQLWRLEALWPGYAASSTNN